MDLFPPIVRSLIADNHLCIIVNDIVNAVDLSYLCKKVFRDGNPSYYPAMKLKNLFYAYVKSIFSSLKKYQVKDI
jgi:transposase